jgi:imidazolonepropionase-like amidohydrolase
VNVGPQRITLDRFTVDGVAWGRETLWLDQAGAFAACVTRASGLSFEGVREAYDTALPAFVAGALQDASADLARLSRQVPPLRTGRFALVGGRLIDGTGRAPIPDAVVVVRDGRIEAAGPRTAVPVPAGVTSLDVSGKTIIPGLIESHGHLHQIEWGPVLLAAGVTTARDMGGEFEVVTGIRDAFAQQGLGPRLLLAGLVDGGGPGTFGIVSAATPEEARQVVSRYRAAGFQQIKIYSLVTPSIVRVLCDEAHRRGMTVTGHVPNGMTIEQAVEAGMDQVAHLPIRGDAASDEVRATIAFLAARHTVIDPTQSWNELLGRAEGTPIAAFQPGIVKVPPPIAMLYESAAVAGITSQVARERLERGLRIVKALVDAGVPVVAGTDDGVPGYSLLREVELYGEAGLTPMQALQAATVVPARALGIAGEVGTIEAGKRADLVVLDANPLERLAALRTARYVVSAGRLFESAALWTSVRFKP